MGCYIGCQECGRELEYGEITCPKCHSKEHRFAYDEQELVAFELIETITHDDYIKEKILEALEVKNEKNT